MVKIRWRNTRISGKHYAQAMEKQSDADSAH
jgi:hypothetical protein